MKREDICDLLKGRITPEKFSELYSREISKHSEISRKKGRMTPILNSGIECIVVGRGGLLRILIYAECQRLSYDTLRYLFCALAMDEKVSFSERSIRQSLLNLARFNDTPRLNFDVS